jgi:ADP-heptose:LPS heptosyltransferase
MGDLLCALITVDYIIKEVKHVDPFIWVPDYMLDFSKNVLPPETKVYNFSNATKHFNNKLIGISTKWEGQHTAMRVHPTDFSNHVLIDADLPVEKKNYLKFNNEGIDLTRFNLPEKYVVISVGSTAPTKELPVPVLNKIIEYVITKGYTPVFIGKSASKLGEGKGIDKKFEIANAKLAAIDYTRGIDLTNQTSLNETAAIISKAKAFIGMEGGLTHLAGFTDVKIVSGYSFVNPDILMPIRNNIKGYEVYPVVPEESLACRFCQSNIPLLYNHDFRFCFYGPDDYKCIKQLTFEKWKEAIDKVL